MPTDPRDRTDAALAAGIVTMREGRYAVHFERHLAHPIERVWAALTEAKQLAIWLTEAEVDLREGGHVVLHGQETDARGKPDVTRGTITRLEPPRLLEIATEFHGTLRWHLVAEEDGCKLTFTSTYALSAAWLPVTTARWHGPLAVLTAPQDHAPVAWRDWTMARRAA